MTTISPVVATLIASGIGAVTAVGGTLLTTWLQRKTEREKTAAQAQQAAQQALRAQLQEAHGELLSAMSRFLDPEPTDEEPVFGWDSDVYEVEHLFRLRVDRLRLLSNPVTVRAAEQMVAALVEYLMLLDAVYRKMQEGEFSLGSIVVSKERQRVQTAREAYVRCAQSDMGLYSLSAPERDSIFTSDNPYDRADLRGNHQNVWEIEAEKRLDAARLGRSVTGQSGR